MKPHLKIQFSSRAREQLALISVTSAPGTGFITGGEMGKFMMIDNLFPVSFDQDIDELYRLYFELLGDKLIGVFFKNQDLFLSDWFIGDIILKIKGSQVEFYFCDSNKECSRINV